MLGHLVHMREAGFDVSVPYTPKGDGWMRRAWRALFSKRHEPAH